MAKRKTVCIIGCGVSGLSTAHILQKRGWEVTLYSKDHPIETKLKPDFSSLFPAASIIPHSIYSDALHEIFMQSRQYFNHLFEQNFPGLKIHEHFELFADKRPFPEYASMMNNFQSLDDFSSCFHPFHPDIPIQSGWKFECFFADWNLYFPALIERVLANGARLYIEDLSLGNLLQLSFEYIINCSELGSLKLFQDDNNLIQRGHILNVMDAPLLLNPEDKTVSYNFSPGADVYQSEAGNRQDVYCYPRSNGWVLGGSRQQGELDQSENWTGEVNIEPFSEIDGMKVPSQILELNSKIIQNTFGINPGNYSNIKSKLGYRYIRKTKDGLRLEAEEINDKLIIHNYGHGGAGVTLSWGCALKAADLLEEAF